MPGQELADYLAYILASAHRSMRMGLSESKVYGLIREGKLKVTKIGRRTFVAEAELVRFLRSCQKR